MKRVPIKPESIARPNYSVYLSDTGKVFMEFKTDHKPTPDELKHVAAKLNEFAHYREQVKQ
jgi:hypothetical protein